MDSVVILGIGLVVGVILGALLGFITFFGLRTLRRNHERLQQDVAALRLDVKNLTSRLVDAPRTTTKASEAKSEEELAEPEVSDAGVAETPAAPPPLPPQLPEIEKDASERAYAARTEQDTPKRTTPLDAESTIGGKITIWVGGLALAFGGLFLVRYAIENAVLSPAARVTLGFAFGALVAALGEWTRRRPNQYALPGFERANIPAILTSVGIFIMFAAVYAAHGLYELIGPVVAFAALSVLALGVMALSLVHGPSLGGLGLVVSYAVPFLISTETDSILGLAIYVLAVSAAALAVARIRGWLWLALSAIGAMFAFAVLFQVTVPFSEPIIVSLYLAAAVALAFTTFVLSIHDRSIDPDSGIDWLATAVLSLLALPIILHFHESQALPIQVIEMAVLFAVPMAIAYLYPAMRYVVFVPALIACGRYLTMSVPATEASAEQLLSPSLLTIEILASVPTYASICATASAALLAWSSWAALRSPARAPMVATAAASALLLLFIAYGRITQFLSTAEFTSAALVLFALFHIQASLLHARIEQSAPGRDQAIASALIGSLVALAFAAAIALEGAGLTIALGLIAGATVITYLRYPLVELRAFAVLAVLPYATRLMWEPFIDPTALISAPPFFNVLLWGYGIPTAGFIASAIVLTRAKNDIWAQMMQAAAIVASVMTVALLALHAIDPFFRFFGRTDALAAAATLVMVGGAFSLGLTRLDTLSKSPVLSRGADVLGGLGILGGAVSLCLFFNPVLGPVGVRFGSIRVGESLLFNLIGYAYALPALLFAMVVRQGWGKKHKVYINLALGFTALLAFAWVNLTIRQVFSPNNLTLEPVLEAELYTYSVIWLLIGIAMLAAGIYWRNLQLRAASGLVLVVVVLKVFLLDLSNLDGILRAISFIGLGAVLLGIGVVYQRALRRVAKSAPESDQSG